MASISEILESILTEEESQVAAASIVTDVTNVTTPQRPVRNVKPPPRFQELCNNTESEEEASSSTSEDSSENEGWKCKKCGKDDGDAGGYIGSDNCDRWFHKRCTTFTNKNQYFESHLCKFEKSSMN